MTTIWKRDAGHTASLGVQILKAGPSPDRVSEAQPPPVTATFIPQPDSFHFHM